MIRSIVFMLCFVIVHSLHEGDHCTVTRTNSSGTCIQLIKCRSALEDFRMRQIPPQLCETRKHLLLCCRGVSANTNIEEDKRTLKEIAVDAVNILAIHKARYTKLVIGGKPAQLEEFPYMAALGYVNPTMNISWDCGGTLISRQWIMSAAHCLFNNFVNANVSKVRLGEIDLSVDAEPQNLYDIIEIVKHPDYIGTQAYNDITLLKLDRPVKYSRSVHPAHFCSKKSVNDSEAIATGFGVTILSEGKASKSDILLKVTLEKFTKEECSPYYQGQRKTPNGIIETQICYGSRDGSKDTCQGDSGGPLQIKYGNYAGYKVIGITSKGKQCGINGVPAIYTEVSAYIPWIKSVIWPN